MMTNLTSGQIQRYSRQITLPQIREKGQEILLNSKALVIGVGGLGSPTALYLAAQGVGVLGIADDDAVELSNLQRQILHFTSDIGLPKTESATEKLRRLNPDVHVRTHELRVNSKNILDLIDPYDVILDGTDNFAGKFLINDACVMMGKPLVHAGVSGFVGQIMTVLPGQGPCYRCIFPEPPPPDVVPAPEEAGILGAVPGVIGALQAIEVIKVLLGIGSTLNGSLLTFDALKMEFRKVPISRDTSCAVCGENPSITELVDYE